MKKVWVLFNYCDEIVGVFASEESAIEFRDKNAKKPADKIWWYVVAFDVQGKRKTKR